MDPQHFGKPDPGYPLYREKPHPYSQSSQKAIRFRIKVKSWDLLRLNMEP
jgi:hypothetical protein